MRFVVLDFRRSRIAAAAAAALHSHCPHRVAAAAAACAPTACAPLHWGSWAMPKHASKAQRSHAQRARERGVPLTCGCGTAAAGQPRRCACNTIQNQQKDKFGADAPVITRRVMGGIVKKSKAFGDENHKPQTRRKTTLRNSDMRLIRRELGQRVTTSTRSLRGSLGDSRGVAPPKSTVDDAIRGQLGYTRKKVSLYNPRRSHKQSALARRSIRAYDVEKMLFLDGSHLAKGDWQQRYGRSKRNAKAMSPSLVMGDEGLQTLMCAYSTEGFEMDTFELISGPMTTERYVQWAEQKLEHRMAPYDPLKPPQEQAKFSHVALDNVNLQHSHPLMQFFRRLGVRVTFLACYDPRCAPIEHGFGQVKAWMRRNGHKRRVQEVFFGHFLGIKKH